MSSHIEITFTDLQPEQQDMLIAQLAEKGFEGFEQNDAILKAFIPSDNYDKDLLRKISNKHQLVFTEQIIAEQNWNAVWESNFEPVIVDDFVAIRAAFHSPIHSVKHEIIITPKMSFGTGHHATTEMMIRRMKEIDITDKTVFDFGTGTGVLAILAEKLGARKIIAVDNDDWSISNATENIQTNNCSRIRLRLADSVDNAERFDIILANINKNVIMENFPLLVEQLNVKGTLLLSGLLERDESDILEIAGKYPLKFNGKTTDRGWVCLQFTY